MTANAVGPQLGSSAGCRAVAAAAPPVAGPWLRQLRRPMGRGCGSSPRYESARQPTVARATKTSVWRPSAVRGGPALARNRLHFSADGDSGTLALPSRWSGLWCRAGHGRGLLGGKGKERQHHRHIAVLGYRATKTSVSTLTTRRILCLPLTRQLILNNTLRGCVLKKSADPRPPFPLVILSKCNYVNILTLTYIICIT